MNTNKENILWNQKTIFDSITPFTLLDFKSYPSAILWCSGCDMRCKFCYNTDIVLGTGKYNFEDLEAFLISRKNLLKGVVICGGEPTIHKELFEIIQAIKKMGLKIKLDTNGLHPKMIKKLIEHDLIDFVALDFKTHEQKLYDVVGVQNHHFSKFEQSLDILLHSKIEYEIRTTIHHSLHSIEDINIMLNFLQNKNYTKSYYVQNFIDVPSTLGNIKRENKLLAKEKIESSNYSFDIIYRNF